ncbi:hypothetical protein WL82_28905 [Burkholderia ubonensis]|uniref:WD40/YVTN/BNR-like repeat-containing protein n=1 Tax=Burkholderia ubonensis TaxID=101571 RepID=UPI00075C141D|nr:hypothetical protein [Burkholderia ubonensis]KWF15206.1 hypothetical protein WL82_28905 [Burkholderia ubonensis]
MSFFPIGPDFVFGPRDFNFKRVSVRNEFGCQAMVRQIAIDPTDANTIYVLARPVSGGSAVFRSDDGGSLWTSIFDGPQRADIGNARPNAIALNPVNSDTIYVATDNAMFYVSSDRGNTWSGRTTMGGTLVRQLIVDPRSAGSATGAVIIAADMAGVLVSPTGGASWSNVLPGNCTTVAASFAGAAGGDYYATLFQQGLFYATSVSGPWANLCAQSIGLPPRGTGTNVAFDDIAVALCRANNRVYAWQARSGKTTGIFTSTSPSAAWQAMAGTPPDPGQGLYSFGLSVAPNSPGDGVNDILFFPGYQLFRSTDSGVTWSNASSSYDAFHNDYHTVVFAPDPAPPGVIPGTYVGCDGGIALSTGFADPTVALGSTTDFDAENDYTTSEVLQNLNHGLHGVGVYAYACDPRFPALSYIGSQDTAVAVGNGALGWRELDWGFTGQQEGDGFKLAVTAGSDGMKTWFYLGAPHYIRLVTDRGGFDNPEVDCRLSGNGSLMVATSNLVVGLDGQCLAGGWLRDDTGNKLTAPISASGSQSATPASINGIVPGVMLEVDGGTSNAENVLVTAVAGATFTASFAKPHNVGASVVLQRFPIVRIDQSGNMVQVSQDFGPTSVPRLVAVHPSDPGTLYCSTRDQRVFTTNVGANANSSTVWTEVATAKPTDIRPGNKFIVGLAVDSGGNAYVLCNDLVHIPSSSEFNAFDTPLFTVNGGMWVGQPVNTNVPSATFGPLLVDPVQANTLYAVRVNKLFRAVNGPNGWDWSDISDGLPGAPINDVWIANIGGATPKVILRAACSTRGVFERDVTAGTTDAPIALYLRANFLDLAQLPTPPSGVTNPFDGMTQVFHYQSEDIKIDAQRAEGFFQTDPEAPPPISHVIFDQLQDNSENLPSTDAALVHVQVHNRSLKPANNVQVWALYANASAGLPPLPGGFVKNFLATGKISPSVPSGSAWTPLGPPQTLNDIAAGAPKVASWPWRIPTLAFGLPGHFCLAAFVHSAASPFSDASPDVDDLAMRVKQVGQKNLHIGPPLNAGPFPPSGSASGGAGGAAGAGSGAAGAAGSGASGRPQHAFHTMREYVEFHNPATTMRQATIVFDLRGLPSQLRVAFRLSRLETVKPLTSSISGARERKRSLAGWLSDAVDEIIDDPIKHAIDGIEDFFEKLFDEDDDREQRRPTIPIDPPIYVVDSPVQVRIDGVVLSPGSAGAAEIAVRNTGTLPPGSVYWFQVQQWVGTQLVGGSIYKVRIAGTPLRVPLPTMDLPDTVITNYPLWAEDEIEQERQRQRMTDSGA